MSKAREHADHAALAGAHVCFLPINDRVPHVYLHTVGAGRDADGLRMVVDCRRPRRLHAIDE